MWAASALDSSAAADSRPEQLGAGRTAILPGCAEGSFVAMLLRTDSLIGCEERSFDSSAAADSLPEKLGAGRTAILIGCVQRSFVAMLLRTDSLIRNLVNNKTPSPLCFS